MMVVEILEPSAAENGELIGDQHANRGEPLEPVNNHKGAVVTGIPAGMIKENYPPGIPLAQEKFGIGLALIEGPHMAALKRRHEIEMLFGDPFANRAVYGVQGDIDLIVGRIERWKIGKTHRKGCTSKKQHGKREACQRQAILQETTGDSETGGRDTLGCDPNRDG